MKLICTYNICSFGWSQVGREFEIRSFCDKLEELPNKCAIFERKTSTILSVFICDKRKILPFNSSNIMAYSFIRESRVPSISKKF